MIGIVSLLDLPLTFKFLRASAARLVEIGVRVIEEKASTRIKAPSSSLIFESI